MERVSLLGVPIDPVTADEAVGRIRMYLNDPSRQHHVMTPNAEMLVEAIYRPSFHALLLETSLNLPDSVGLLHMAKRTGQHLPERVTGVDTVTTVCTQLQEDHPVFFLGGRDGVAQKAAAILQQRNPNLSVAGTYEGSPKEVDAPTIIERINAAQPHLLLVAYGAPQQDEWIHRHLADVPSVRVAVGVGGTFDFLAGERKRAPFLFRKMGLEWLWRLLLQPSRALRIWNAVVVFPLLVMRYGKEAPHS